MNSDFSDVKREYLYSSLNEADMKSDPLEQFDEWLQKATQEGTDPPNAMVLATASKAGMPTARYVLLKEFSSKGFVFYTNADSIKGQHLRDNPMAALVFYWSSMDRQVRIEGSVLTVSAMEADEYFRTRPYDSRLAARVAAQSSIVESREFMEGRLQQLQDEFPDDDVPRPENWVGYRVVPEAIEFWQGRENRLHDRIVYRREDNDAWSMQRLAP